MLIIESDAFKLGVFPQSHVQTIVTDELELTFIQKEKHVNVFSSTLFKQMGNVVEEEQFFTYEYITNGQLNIKIKPPESGNYKLKVCGQKRSASLDGGGYCVPQLFEYVLRCKVPPEKSSLRRFPYPKTSPQAFIDDCQVLEPLGVQIKPHTRVRVRFKSPYLKQMLVYQMMLKKTGDFFEGVINTPSRNCLIDVYGSRSNDMTLIGMNQFCVG